MFQTDDSFDLFLSYNFKFSAVFGRRMRRDYQNMNFLNLDELEENDRKELTYSSVGKVMQWIALSGHIG